MTGHKTASMINELTPITEFILAALEEALLLNHLMKVAL